MSQAFRDALYDQYRSSNEFKKSQRIIKEQARKIPPKGASSVDSDGLSTTQDSVNEERPREHSRKIQKKRSIQKVIEDSHEKAGKVEAYGEQTTYPPIRMHQMNLASSHQEPPCNTNTMDSRYYYDDKVLTRGLERDLNSTTNYSNSCEMRFTPDSQNFRPLDYGESTEHGLRREKSLDMWDKFTKLESRQSNPVHRNPPSFQYLNSLHHRQFSSLASACFASNSIRNTSTYNDNAVGNSKTNTKFGLTNYIQPVSTNHQLSDTQRQFTHECVDRILPSLNIHAHENRNSEGYDALRGFINSYELTNAGANNDFEPIPLPLRTDGPQNDECRKFKK